METNSHRTNWRAMLVLRKEHPKPGSGSHRLPESWSCEDSRPLEWSEPPKFDSLGATD